MSQQQQQRGQRKEKESTASEVEKELETMQMDSRDFEAAKCNKDAEMHNGNRIEVEHAPVLKLLEPLSWLHFNINLVETEYDNFVFVCLFLRCLFVCFACLLFLPGVFIHLFVVPFSIMNRKFISVSTLFGTFLYPLRCVWVTRKELDRIHAMGSGAVSDNASELLSDKSRGARGREVLQQVWTGME
jgi:hypothetical protein